MPSATKNTYTDNFNALEYSDFYNVTKLDHYLLVSIDVNLTFSFSMLLIERVDTNPITASKILITPTYAKLRYSFNQNPVWVWVSVIFPHHFLAHFPCRPCLINGHSFRCRVLIVVHFNYQLLHSRCSEFLQRYPNLLSFDPLMLLLLQERKVCRSILFKVCL